MTAILFLIFAAAIFVIISTRFTLISLFLVSSSIYVLPAFWLDGIPAVVLLSWCAVFMLGAFSQLLLAASISRGAARTRHELGAMHQTDSRSTNTANLVFNYATLLAFALLVYYNGGVGVFFEGKYGGAAQNLLLYYAWNSLLFLTSVHNLLFRRFLSPLSLIAVGEIFLLFVAGDRTIPIMYLAAAIYNYFHGAAPIALPKKARAIVFLSPIILPMAIISKSIYAILPKHGFTLETADLIIQNFADWAVKDFEPSHVMLMFKSIALHGLPYGWTDLLRGLPAILPFSSYMNVDPHIFSETVKHRFFSSWGPAAGVGANFWAQGYVLLGIAGVLVFAGLVLISLGRLERAIARTRSSIVQATLLTCGVIIGFYVHRNSLEQILAFVGRYALIGIVVGVIAQVVCNSVAARGSSVGMEFPAFGANRLGRPRVQTLDAHGDERGD